MLAIARRKLIRSNALALPGTLAGFDQSHPASLNCYVSAVCRGANFTGIGPGVGGGPGTLTGTPTGSVSNVIGSALTAATTARTSFTISSLGLSFVTLAAMVFWTGTNAASQDICGYDTSAAGNGNDLALNASGVPMMRNGAGTSVATTALNTNTPYFLVVSGSGSTINIVYVNLLTGQVFSQSNAAAINGTGNATFTVCNVGDGGRPFNGSVAAAMMSKTFLSIQQLLQWAADPWSFWYPR